MLIQVPYDRQKAVRYAKDWAMKRNPHYMNFDSMGGDCTNYASQCVFAGCGQMNYTPTFGWFYNSPSDRAAAWSGVQFLYNFLISNSSSGPFAAETELAELSPGDLVQLGTADGRFYHTPVVLSVSAQEVLVAAHTSDAYMRPLFSYSFERLRCLHITGARRWK